MQIDWWTFGLQAINFLVLVWLLQRFLYRPVLAVIARRRAEAEKSFQEAGRREALADKARHEAEAERSSEVAARDKMMAGARAEMEGERKKMIEQARNDAAAIADAARAKIGEERGEALKSLRAKAIDLGVDVANQLLAQTVSKSLNDVFLERICGHLAELSAERRAELESEIGRDGKLTVVTAAALDKPEQDRWRKEIGGALKAKPATDFAVDPALIAGAELRFRNAILRFSWRDSVEQARRELKSRADAQ